MMSEYMVESLKEQAEVLRRNADILEAAANGMNEKEIAKKVDRSVSKVRCIVGQVYRMAAIHLRDNIMDLNAAGYSKESIARQLNVSLQTVRNIIAAAEYPRTYGEALVVDRDEDE